MSTSSHSELYRKLDPVRRRLNRRIALRCAAEGLAVGAAVAATVVLCGMVLFPQTVIYIGLATLFAGPLLGALAAALLKTDQRAAARLVDQHYGLKDRAVTALQNLEKKSPSPVEIFQLRDTLQHLQKIDPAKVVPFSFRAAKRPLLRGIVLTAGAVVLMLAALWGDFGVIAGIMPDKPRPERKKITPPDVPVSPALVRQSLQAHRRDEVIISLDNTDQLPQGEQHTIRRYFTDNP